MSRPHVEFIQSQILPFRQGLYGGGRPHVMVRTLSIDDQDGSSSTMVRYPAGWDAGAAHVLNADEELFVLEGALELNGRSYGKHAYAHLPAGYLRTSFSSPGGAVVLTFFSAEPSAQASDKSVEDFDSRRLVEHIDTRAMPGQTGKRKHMNSGDWDTSGTINKTLYTDPDSGEVTWLIGMMPYWSTPGAEIHPVVEEEFAILGDLCFPMGVMRDGGYFWRPPGVQHGPFASWGGALHLCRCKGGPFGTEWVETDPPDWQPAYQPILPPEYQRYAEAAGDYDREPNY
jgi:hypothetical protein